MTVLSIEPRPQVRGADLPYDDGIPLESEWHLAAMTLLIDILRYRWRERRDHYVNGNMFVYFDPDQVKTRNFRGPDLFVVKGVKDNRFRKSWVVWEEDGLTPDFVIELASESTAKFDLSRKKAIYEQVLKTPEYIVYNPDTGVLQGWRLRAGRYLSLVPNTQGWLWSEELELWLGVTEYTFANQAEPTQVLRFFDEQGKPIPTREEARDQRAKSEAQRAETEAQRAEAEAQRAEAEAQRAEAANQRAQVAEQHAQAETQARQAAEAEITRLKALLKAKHE